MHINILELQAAHFACQVFLPLMESHHIQLLSNNVLDNKNGGCIYQQAG